MAYVYRINFKLTNQFYIGFRGAKDATPDDLFKTYFTSSKVIKRLIKDYGVDQFSTEILAEFKTGKEAYEYEQKLLNEMDVSNNSQMLNMRATSCALGTFKKHTEDTKQKISEAKKEFWKDPKRREHSSKFQKAKWADPDYYQEAVKKYQTEEHRAAKSMRAKKMWTTEEYRESQKQKHKEALANPEYRKWHSIHKSKLWENSEYKKKASEARKQEWSDPEYRKKMSDMRKRLWADPAYRKKMLDARKKKKD